MVMMLGVRFVFCTLFGDYLKSEVAYDSKWDVI